MAIVSSAKFTRPNQIATMSLEVHTTFCKVSGGMNISPVRTKDMNILPVEAGGINISPVREDGMNIFAR